MGPPGGVFQDLLNLKLLVLLLLSTPIYIYIYIRWISSELSVFDNPPPGNGERITSCPRMSQQAKYLLVN